MVTVPPNQIIVIIIIIISLTNLFFILLTFTITILYGPSVFPFSLFPLFLGLDVSSPKAHFNSCWFQALPKFLLIFLNFQ